MKVGAENKKKALLALLLMVFSVFLLIRTLKSSSGTDAASPRTGLAPKPDAPKTEAKNRPHIPRPNITFSDLDPEPRLDLLAESENLTYEGTGRNIFSDTPEASIPTPQAPGLIKPAEKEKPKWISPSPASPPPIDLKFYGWASEPGEPKAIFLAKGDDVFVAHEGDIIARRYKIVRITTDSVEIEDMLTNNKQSIRLVQG